MSFEWPQVRLGDCIELATGYPFKSADYTDANDGIRLLRGDNIAQGLMRWSGVKRWPNTNTQGIESYFLKEGDIVLAMDRPWIAAGLKFSSIRKSDLPALLVQRVARIRPLPGVDSGFLHCLIASSDFSQYIQSVTTGTAVPHISAKQICDYQFRLPDESMQKKCGRIVMAMDDRISLLRETNVTLEAIAQALFKSWFVDFDPVRAKAEGRQPESLDATTAALFPDSFEESELGCVPKGWRVEKLEGWLSVLETGRRPKGGISGISEGVPSIGAESIVRIGQFDYSKTKYVSEEFFEKMKSGALESNDVLLYKDGGKPGVFLPRVSMFGDGYPFEKCGINEHVFRIRLKAP